MSFTIRSAFRSVLTGTVSVTACLAFAGGAAAQGAGLAAVTITGTLASSDVLGALRGVSVSEITPEDIEIRQVRNIGDVLRDVPGLAVNRTGGFGGQTQVRIRGGEGNHTLVLIDGIEASEPFQGEFDFATLIADDIAQVEVLRGQQSALYGSDAIGGVIHYTTPSGRDYPGLRARVEGGSFGTYAGALRFGGFTDKFDYVLNGAYYQTDGDVVARNGSDEIGSENFSVAGKFVLTPVDVLTLTAVARYSLLDTDTAPQDFDFPPGPDFGLAVDGDDTVEAEIYYALFKGELELLDGDWTHAAAYQGVWADRTSATLAAPTFITEGARRKLSYVTSFFFGMDGADNSITLALDNEEEKFRNAPLPGVPPATLNRQRTLTTTGIVGEYNLNLNESFGLAAAARHDWNDKFEDSNTYRVSAGYLFDMGLKVHAAYGTGFKAPTNFELFGFDPGSFIGNPDLKPETSRGWEAGVQYEAGEGITVGATYFRNVFENEIFTAFTPSFESTPDNRDTDSRQQGVELFASLELDNGFSFDGSYTYLDAEENGAEEIRRAPHIASATLSWRSMDERFGAFIGIRYNGKQKDTQFLAGPPFSTAATVNAFTLVNAGAEWSLNDNIEFFGRVENLFDEEYEEVFSYRGSGRAFYAGIRGNM